MSKTLKRKRRNTIFVSIASYRDPDIIKTIIDCINKAENPKSVFFGICLQDNKETYNILRGLRRKYKINMKIEFFDWRDSQGACWARYIIQKKLFNNQDYYLQLDSHHRFIEQWDAVLLDMLKKKQSEGFKKPIIGGYCPGFNAENNTCENVIIQISSFDLFSHDGDMVFKPMVINEEIKGSSCIPARFLSGHFIFTIGQFCKDCIYDPNLYFRGEEITLSARAFTNGYDFFHPNMPIIWHFYIRSEDQKHWDNHKNNNGFIIGHNIRDKKAKERVRKLLGSEKNNINFGVYGLGSERSLHDYELYCGLDFKTQRVHRYANNIMSNAPFAYTMSEQEWDNMLMKKLIVLKIDKKIVKEITPNLESLIICIENHKKKLLYRSDIKQNEVIELLKNNLEYKKVVGIEEVPSQAVVIPYYRDKKFGNRFINNQLNYYDTE